MGSDGVVELSFIDFTHRDFASLTDAEKGVLLVLGHVSNELNALNKILVMCIPRKGDQFPETVANTLHSLMIARLLAVKSNEAWEAVQKSYLTKFFDEVVHQSVRDVLNQPSRDAFSELKRYFNQSPPCLIRRIRRDFGAHYSPREIGEAWDLAATEPKFGIVAADTKGNTFHLGAELAANVAMLRSLDANQGVALEMFFSEVQGTAKMLSDFIDGVVLALVKKCRPVFSEDERIQILGCNRIDDVSICFFHSQ